LKHESQKTGKDQMSKSLPSPRKAALRAGRQMSNKWRNASMSIKLLLVKFCHLSFRFHLGFEL
jgi:hypothetical protein